MHIIKDIGYLCLLTSARASEAAKLMQSQNLKIVLVCDAAGQFKGTITDGDLRRAILESKAANTLLIDIMNPKPHVVREGTHNIDDVYFKMKEHVIKYIPVIDDNQFPTRLYYLSDFEDKVVLDNPVVLMGGGLGMRLRPLTENTPKPLLKVGGKPVIQRLIERLSLQGFSNLYISINYLGEAIMDYLGDGSEYNVNITYLHETQPLGTAGSLSLLDASEINHPLIVINADIITHEELSRALLHFSESDSQILVGVREHYYTLPYGSIDICGDNVIELKEKPTFTYLINSGVYVLSPDVLQLVPSNIPFDMVDLINKLLDMRKSVGYFRMYEEWIDIGQIQDLNRARASIAD